MSPQFWLCGALQAPMRLVVEIQSVLLFCRRRLRPGTQALEQSVAAAPALAMVLHELATNAAKYGALSTPHGRVEVNWSHGPGEDAENLSIAWLEIGGPAIGALW